MYFPLCTTRLLQKLLHMLMFTRTLFVPYKSLESTKIHLKKTQARGLSSLVMSNLLNDVDANATALRLPGLYIFTYRAVGTELCLGHVKHQVGSRLDREPEVDESVKEICEQPHSLLYTHLQ